MHAVIRPRTHLLADATPLHWRERGEPVAGQPSVILLHSLFFHGGMFDAMLAHLDPRWHVICPDHRGQGASPAGGKSLSMAQLAQDHLHLLAAVCTGPVHLVGSSMGGYVALEMLRAEPARFASAVLSCCTAHAEQQPERFAALEQRLREDGPAAHVSALMHTMFGDAFLQGDDVAMIRARAHWNTWFAALPRTVADAVAGVFSRPDYAAGLAALQLPVLLLSGEQDHAKRPADMAFMDAHLPDSRHHVMAQVGHSVPVEAPALYADMLDAFWRDCQPPIPV